MTNVPAMASRPWALLSAGLLIAASVGVFVAQAVQWSSVPADGDWQRAAERIRAQARPGDAFRVEPEWDSRPRVFLQEMEYVPAERATWFDVAPHARVWLLAEAGREDTAVENMPEGWRIGAPEPFGSVSLLLAEPPSPDPTLWDVLGDLERAKVRRERPEGQEDCQTFEDGKWPAWRCGRRDLLERVGETLQVVTNDAHRCLWAMPVDKGGRLVVHFDGVPPGTLSGHYGQPIDAIRSNRGGPVTFEVLAAGEVIHRKTFDIHEEGFLPWSVPLAPAEGASAAALTFSISAPGSQDRFFCFTARVTATGGGQ